jgi:hypothetical protein
MNTKIIIMISVLMAVFAGAGVIGFLFFYDGTNPQQNTGGPTMFPTGSTTSAVMTVKSVLWEDIRVNNFLQDPATVQDPTNQEYYYLGYHPSFTDTEVIPPVPYVIAYVASTHFFNIVLTREPIAESRHEAEQYLMTKLGITEGEMCTLSYMLSVPGYVNEYYSGTSLGFSFCTGAAVLQSPIPRPSVGRASTLLIRYYTPYGTPHTKVTQRQSPHIPPRMPSEIPQKSVHREERTDIQISVFGTRSPL